MDGTIKVDKVLIGAGVALLINAGSALWWAAKSEAHQEAQDKRLTAIEDKSPDQNDMKTNIAVINTRLGNIETNIAEIKEGLKPRNK